MDEIRAWQQLAAQAQAMAASAVAHDWDALAHQETAFREAIAALRARPAAAALPPEERRLKAELIRAILADQDTVREHVEPWLAQVKPLLDAFARGDKAA